MSSHVQNTSPRTKVVRIQQANEWKEIPAKVRIRRA
jgi:hypothetical protein